VRFSEINLLGVYVARISVMMVAAWVVTVGLRRFAARFGLLRHVWHPSLFVFAGLHDRAVLDRRCHRALSSSWRLSKLRQSARRRTVPQPYGRPSLLWASRHGGGASFRC
jgi:hypothetical protein